MTHIENIKTLLKQIFVSKKLWSCILIAIVPAMLFYSLSLIGLRSLGFETMEILRDPAQQSGASSFLGFLSNIGIWFWISSAAISFFTILTSASVIKKNFKELFFLTGMLSLLLAIDDFFLIHDRYVHQNICYLTYAVFLGCLFIRHFKMIIAIEGFAFLTAGIFLGLSIFTDLVQSEVPLGYVDVQIIEEGFKFIGAATWLYFIGRAASSPFIFLQKR
ncbi:hypothetical protein [Spongiimicrobium sp. 3-5]|uniref:hypothetical protein n=1 Tax=Spongiimicrobium sp. 3-5 TaxID=3332596 RepID=UPI003980EE80